MVQLNTAFLNLDQKEALMTQDLIQGDLKMGTRCFTLKI